MALTVLHVPHSIDSGQVGFTKFHAWGIDRLPPQFTRNTHSMLGKVASGLGW